MYSPLKNLFRLNRIIYSFSVIIISLSSLLSAGAPDTLWTKEYGNGPGEACGYSVQETSDNGFIIAGSFEPSVGGPDYTHDVYIIRTDSLGDTLWTRKYGGADDFEEGFSVLQTDYGGFIVAGHTGSDNDPGQVYLIRTDPNGDSLWTKRCDRNNEESGEAIQQTTDGGYIIAGSTGPNGNKSNVYLIRLAKEATGIQEETPSPLIKPDVFIVSHNYGNNHISIRYDIPYTGSVKLEAFDIKGKLLKKLVDTVMPKGSYTVTWDTKQDDNKPLAGGVYFLKLRVNGSEVSRKVTLLR